MRRRGLAWLLALAGVLGAASAVAQSAADWEALAAAAEKVAEPADLAPVAERLGAALPPDEAKLSARDLSGAARVYGALVSRGQALDASSEVFGRLVSLAAPLEARVAARRERLEAEAGEDEARLEALYRSDPWQQLGASHVEISYWLGWAQLARVQGGLRGDAREQALADAERAFARAARALAFPDRALRGLLGLGIARRERGDLDGARQSFERLQAQRAIQSDPELAVVVRYELALTAIDAGDMERAEPLVAALEQGGALTPAQWRALEARRIRAWLAIAKADDGTRGEQARGAAAARIRVLLERGGADAELAGRLVAQFASELVGADIGPLGALLDADRAFQQQDWPKAVAAYEVALESDLPGDVDVAQARLRLAYCKVQLGRSEEALSDLDALLGEKLTDSQRADAAHLMQSVAEARLASAPGAGARADRARASRAAQVLLEVAPEAAGADRARVRRARDLAGRGRVEAALAQLAAVPADSDSYPAALLERVRLEEERLDRARRALSPGSGPQDAALRAPARALLGSLDEVDELQARGALPSSPERDARLAVLRARATLEGGAELARVARQIAAARGLPGLDDASRRALFAVEVERLVAARDVASLAALLAARDDGRVRAELGLWEEALVDLEGVAAAASSLPDLYARLARVAPDASRSRLALRRVAALRAAGRRAEAAELARALTVEDPESGDAWLELARSLDAAGDPEAFSAAWRRVGGGAERGSETWWEAHLALHDAARSRGEDERACGWIGATEGAPVSPAFAKRIEAARAACADVAPPAS